MRLFVYVHVISAHVPVHVLGQNTRRTEEFLFLTFSAMQVFLFFIFIVTVGILRENLILV